MSTNYKISQLRDLFNDWKTGLDQAVTLIPLFSVKDINEYWSMPIQNWGLILYQFLTIFEKRVQL